MNAIDVLAPVESVTLFEDRAQVRRLAKVRLGAGSHRLRVDAVTPVLVDRSLVARLPGARVDDARVVRAWRIGKEESPEGLGPLEAERDRLAREVEAARQREARLGKELASREEAADLLVDAVQRELPFASAFEERWAVDLAAMESSVRELDAGLLDAAASLRGVSSCLGAAQLRLARASGPEQALTTTVEVDVTLEAGAGEALDTELTLDYVVPCALWRPAHRAFLSRSPASAELRFDLEAAVWQRTGEEWEEVVLRFSSARPARRAEPVELSDDLLVVRRRAERKVDVEIRDQVVATTGEGMSRTTGELPGVDDGGETRLYEAARRATIPSDGLLRLVPLDSFAAPVEVDRIARPERASVAFLRTRQTNGAASPLLAGPVELHSEGAFVGRTQIGYVAPGERFALSWGGDSSLRVVRDARQHRETGKLLGKETITKHVDLVVTNLEDAPARLLVEERVPVSEVEAVQVEVVRSETDPAAEPDDDGIVRWDLSFAPFERRKLALVARITAGREVRGL